MIWKLQENALDINDLDIMVSFVQTSKCFTQSSRVREFEEAWSKWQGCSYSVFLNSGSSANLVLVSATKEMYNWNDGDEVIVPAVTWVTNISPVIQLGLKPIFSDVNLADISFDYEQLKDKITERTRAVFITHLLGFPANVEKIRAVIGNRNIVILEDCCEAHGANINNIKVGNFGIGGTFSFYWGHHMTTIEGGMISTNDEELYNLCLLNRSHGLARELPEKHHEKYKKLYNDIDFDFLFLTNGFNLRNTELNATLGLAQLKNIDKFIQTRNENYSKFLKICKNYEDRLLLLDVEGTSSLCLPFIFKDTEEKKRFKVMLTEYGIESRPLISGNLLRQPFLKSYYDPREFKNADFIHNNALYIGNNQFIDEAKLEMLAGIMEKFFKS